MAALGAISASAPAFAQGAEPSSGASAATPLKQSQVRIPLDVSLNLNTRFLGTLSIAVDREGTGDVDAKRLLELLGPVVARPLLERLTARIAGRARVDFAELAVDGFALTFDPLGLELDGAVAADATALTSVAIEQREPAPRPEAFDQPENFAAGVNVAVGQRFVHSKRNGGFQPLRVALDGLMNFGGFDGVTLTAGADYDGASGGQRFRRREIRLTKDDYSRAIRLSAGEFTPSSRAFQGSGRILGASIERAYSTIRPFQNVRPVGRQIFTLQRESTVAVIVNDVRVQTLRLQAGRYDIADFPFAAGPNRIRLEIEDNAGRQEIAAFDIFSGADLLNPGLTDFGLAVGLREKQDAFSYGRSPVASGYLNLGVTDNLTLGGNAQASTLAVQLGGTAVWGSRFGFFQAEATLSRSGDGGDLGAALSVDYRGEFSLLSKQDFRLTATAILYTPDFQDAFIRARRNPQALQTAVLALWNAPFDVSLGVGYSYASIRSGRNVARTDFSLGRSFGRFSLSATGARSTSERGGHEWRAAIGLSVTLGSRWYGTARHDTGEGRSEIELSRSSNGEIGDVSGNVRLARDRDGRGLAGRLSYINNRFDAGVEHNRLISSRPDGPTTAESSWRASTFIGYAGGSVGIGRTISDGFIIAPRHRTLDGAQIQLKQGDRVVARSGLFGPATVAVARAYAVNRYEVGVDPLPAGYDIGSGLINTFPGFGSGYRLTIGSDASRTALGVLQRNGAPLALVGGTVERIGAGGGKTEPRSFFTNRAGRFVADRLAPGRYRLMVGGEAVGEFEIPANKEGVVDVGKIGRP